jgi:triphosphoribosyl-dephospho-CoA synthase
VNSTVLNPYNNGPSVKNEDLIEQTIAVACALDATTFKPGNVSPWYSAGGATYKDFIASGKAIASVISSSGESASLGDVVLKSVKASQSAQPGGNTHLGTIMLLVPLAMSYRAGIAPDEWKAAADKLVKGAGPDDAAKFLSAIKIAAPKGLTPTTDYDVNSPDALARIESEAVSLRQWMAAGSQDNLIAREYAEGFNITLNSALPLLGDCLVGSGDVRMGLHRTFITLLASFEDSLVIGKCGLEIAVDLKDRARTLMARKGDEFERGGWRLHEHLLQVGANPGTTADLTTAAAFALMMMDDDLRERCIDGVKMEPDALHFLRDEKVYESVLVSMKDGQPNAAAIGIWLSEGRLAMRSYAGTRTFLNLQAGAPFTINLYGSDGLGMIIAAALRGEGDENDENEFDASSYCRAGPGKNAPMCLVDSPIVLRCILVKAGEAEVVDKISTVKYLLVDAIVDAVIFRRTVEPFSREAKTLLDAAVAATRARAAQGRVRKKFQRRARKFVKRHGCSDNNESVQLIEKYLSDID